MRVALLALAACGRIGFDPLADDGRTAVERVPVVVQTGNPPSDGSATIAVPINPTGAGHLLVVATGTYAPPMPVASVHDDQNNTYVSTGMKATSTVGVTEIWYTPSCAANTTMITVAFTGAPTSEAWVLEVAGTDPTSPLDSAAVTSAGAITDPVAAPTVSPTTTHSFIVSALEGANSVAQLHAGSPFTALPTIDGDDTAFAVVSTPGAYGAVWDDVNTTEAFDAITVAFKPASE